MIKFAKSKKVRILFASLSEIDGNPEVDPKDERYFGSFNILDIRSSHAEG